MNITHITNILRTIASSPAIGYGTGAISLLGVVGYALYQKTHTTQAPLTTDLITTDRPRPFTTACLITIPSVKRPRPPHSSSLPSLGHQLVMVAKALASEGISNTAIPPKRGVHNPDPPSFIENRIKGLLESTGQSRSWKLWALRQGCTPARWAASLITPEATETEQELIDALNRLNNVTIPDTLRGQTLLAAVQELSDNQTALSSSIRQKIVALKQELLIVEAIDRLTPILLKIMEDNPDHPLTTHSLTQIHNLLVKTRFEIPFDVATVFKLVQETIELIGAEQIDQLIQHSRLDAFSLISTLGILTIGWIPHHNTQTAAPQGKAKASMRRSLQKSVGKVVNATMNIGKIAIANDSTLLELDHVLGELRESAVDLLIEQADINGVFTPPQDAPRQISRQEAADSKISQLAGRLLGSELLDQLEANVSAAQAAAVISRTLNHLVPAFLEEIDEQNRSLHPDRQILTDSQMQLARAAASFLPYVEKALNNLTETHPDHLDQSYRRCLSVTKCLISESRAPTALELLSIFQAMTD